MKTYRKYIIEHINKNKHLIITNNRNVLICCIMDISHIDNVNVRIQNIGNKLAKIRLSRHINGYNKQIKHIKPNETHLFEFEPIDDEWTLKDQLVNY